MIRSKLFVYLVGIYTLTHITLIVVCMNTDMQMPFLKAGLRLMLLTSLYSAQFLKIMRMSETNSLTDW